MQPILVIDIGNSNIVVGAMAHGQLLHSARIDTVHGESTDSFAMRLAHALAQWPTTCHPFAGGMLSSVVPELTEVVRRGTLQATGTSPAALGDRGVDIGMPLAIDHPELLGHDRIADAIGAMALFEPPLVVVDMGTATTINVVSAERQFIGGMIIPGMRTSFDALCSKASQLSQIPLELPEVLIGRNTTECMQSGLLYGYASMVDGLLSRIARQMGTTPNTVLTGGLAPLIADLCEQPMTYREHLLLEGLYHIYIYNVGKSHKA